MNRPFPSLLGAVVLLGLADSLVGAYFVLFLSDGARLSATEIGVLFSLPAVGGLAVSFWLGRRFDRRPTRTWVLLVTAASAVGYALMTTTTSFAWLLLISLTLLAGYQAAYPQLFSLAHTALTADRTVPLLRSGWSAAWAVGPVAGAFLVPRIGVDGVLWVAVGVLGLTVLTTATVPAPAPNPPPHRPSAGTPAVRPRGPVSLTASVVCFFLAMFAGSLALPLYVTRDLDLPAAVVGWSFGVCAAVEVIASLALAAWGHRVGQRALIVGGMLALAGHFVVVLLARGTVLLLVSQVPRGLAIAIVTTAGMRFFQQASGLAAGSATTVFSAATDAGFLLAGVLGGVGVDVLGLRTALVGCALVATAAAATFLAAARSPTGP